MIKPNQPGPSKKGGAYIPIVLIIDDDNTTGLMLELILSKEGFSVLRAQNGRDGRALAEHHQPDLILLDINMPDEDGLMTCTALKNNQQTAEIPVVFISAMENVEAKVEGFNVGAVDYITKPYHPAEVLARVRLHIRLRQAYRAMIDSYLEQFKTLTQAQQLLLVQPGELPEARFAVYYTALQAAGGDFYDVIHAGEGIYDYLVADVSGHDLGTSLATAAIKALIRQNVAMLYSPAENLGLLNRHIHSVLHVEQYATLIYARLNRARRRLTLVSAGHPAAILVHAGGESAIIRASGDILGIFETVSLEAQEISVQTSDRLFLFSDGVVEQGRQGATSRKQGMSALQDLAIKTRHLPPDEALNAIVGELLPPQDQQRDDIVLLVVDV